MIIIWSLSDTFRGWGEKEADKGILWDIFNSQLTDRNVISAVSDNSLNERTYAGSSTWIDIMMWIKVLSFFLLIYSAMRIENFSFVTTEISKSGKLWMLNTLERREML